MYIAHKREDGKQQGLREHLCGVAEQASQFAKPFGASKAARRTGMLHDVGKASRAGLRRMKDPKHTAKVDHATAGAVEAKRRSDAPSAFAISGHHGGLMDAGDLRIRLEKDLTGDMDYTAYMDSISVDGGELTPSWLSPRDKYAAHFYTRMLFSCLVDADFLNTEAFMKDEAPPRGGGDNIGRLLELHDKYAQEHFSAKPGAAVNAINKKRSEILRECRASGECPQGLYTLTVPTGGGKTIASLAFALSHAVANKKRRVIYVVPYTSIIEQSASVFSDILGSDNVLEHHSHVDYTDDSMDAENLPAMRKRLAAENWDAPVIVTTAVQFFESLYSSSVSRCRKLHNIADSVVVFDEAQMMPLPFLRPCVAAIVELVRHYGVTAILCTATQPALGEILREFAPEMRAREICSDTEAMYEFFRRVRYKDEGSITEEHLARELGKQAQVLCIVNTRKQARQIYGMLPKEGRYHLSTLMTPQSRSRTLKNIKSRLDDGLPCRVVSTSLIEAGVDVNFPSVWREEAGLDSIIQAAGRCNREGKDARDESIVHVFRFDDIKAKHFAQQIYSMRTALSKSAEMDAPQTIHAYFESLLGLRGKDALDIKDILPKSRSFAFKTVAEAFRMIDEDAVPVYIPTSNNAPLLDRLRNGDISRHLMRKLAATAVNVYRSAARSLAEAGKLETTQDGSLILSDEKLYSEETGLQLNQDAGY